MSDSIPESFPNLDSRLVDIISDDLVSSDRRDPISSNILDKNNVLLSGANLSVTQTNSSSISQEPEDGALIDYAKPIDVDADIFNRFEAQRPPDFPELQTFDSGIPNRIQDFLIEISRSTVLDTIKKITIDGASPQIGGGSIDFPLDQESSKLSTKPNGFLYDIETNNYGIVGYSLPSPSNNLRDYPEDNTKKQNTLDDFLSNFIEQQNEIISELTNRLNTIEISFGATNIISNTLDENTKIKSNSDTATDPSDKFLYGVNNSGVAVSTVNNKLDGVARNIDEDNIEPQTSTLKYTNGSVVLSDIVSTSDVINKQTGVYNVKQLDTNPFNAAANIKLSSAPDNQNGVVLPNYFGGATDINNQSNIQNKAIAASSIVSNTGGVGVSSSSDNTDRDINRSINKDPIKNNIFTSNIASPIPSAVEDTTQTTGPRARTVRDTSETANPNARAVRGTSETANPNARAVRDTSETANPNARTVRDTSETVNPNARAVRDTSERANPNARPIKKEENKGEAKRENENQPEAKAVGVTLAVKMRRSDLKESFISYIMVSAQDDLKKDADGEQLFKSLTNTNKDSYSTNEYWYPDVFPNFPENDTEGTEEEEADKTYVLGVKIKPKAANAETLPELVWLETQQC